MPHYARSWLMQLAGLVRRGGVIICEHTLSAAQTRQHVELLSRSFDFIHHDELAVRLERPRSRPFCLFTFDDGKRSNATEAAPELMRMGVPAVFYLTTQAVADGTPLWFDRYAALRRALGYAPTGLEADQVKLLPFAQLMERLDRACAEHGVAPDLECDDVRPMTWSEARELARQGFTLGAHGVRHSILTRETENVAVSEIEESLGAVTAAQGKPCSSFAFPNGNYTPRLAQRALEFGATTVMTVEPRWADRRDPLWRLPRVMLFGQRPPGKMALKITLAAAGLAPIPEQSVG